MMKFLGTKTVVFLACLLFSAGGATVSRAGEIKNVRMGAANGGQARIVVDLSQKTAYKTFTLQKPARLVVDLEKTSLGKAEKSLKDRPDYLKNARAASLGKNDARLVLEFDKEVAVKKSFLLAPQSGFQWRLVIDAVFKEVAPQPVKTAESNEDVIRSLIENSPAFAASAPQKQANGSDTDKNEENDDDDDSNATAALPAALQNPNGLKYLVVLDAGHGGKDPGAIGRSYKTKEKDITLALVKQLRDLLVKTGRYRVRLTRESDVAISLWGRRKFAHDIKADLFISIHADSSANNRQARGLSIYTLSETASDKEAEKLAERENKADIIAGMDLSAETQEVTDILIDLARRETNNHSSFFAEGFVKELSREVKILPNAHRFAGFAVLKSPDVPSVLIETGYLSNREEEQLLRQASYREKLARASMRAIDKYFSEKHKANFN